MTNLTPTSFESSLIDASFRGVPFHVIDNSIKAGLRIAEHQYPYRNTPYSEPMGKAARQYTVTAFLTGDGGDLQTQLNSLLDALENNTPGTLVHPMLGSLNVVALPSEIIQTVAGRYLEMKLAFIEAGSVLSPTTAADTQANTINQAATSTTATTTSFNNDVTNGSLPASTDMNPSTSPSPAASTINDAGDQAVQSNNTGFGLA